MEGCKIWEASRKWYWLLVHTLTSNFQPTATQQQPRQGRVDGNNNSKDNNANDKKRKTMKSKLQPAGLEGKGQQ